MRAAGRGRRSGPAEGPRRSCRDRGGVGRPRASRAGGTRSGAGEGAAFRRVGPGSAALHEKREVLGGLRMGVLRGSPAWWGPTDVGCCGAPRGDGNLGVLWGLPVVLGTQRSGVLGGTSW